jgi:hypothetical protein
VGWVIGQLADCLVKDSAMTLGRDMPNVPCTTLLNHAILIVRMLEHHQKDVLEYLDHVYCPRYSNCKCISVAKGGIIVIVY